MKKIQKEKKKDRLNNVSRRTSTKEQNAKVSLLEVVRVNTNTRIVARLCVSTRERERERERERNGK